MQEWLNWPAWKASKRQKRFRGSNPLLSALATTDQSVGCFFIGRRPVSKLPPTANKKNSATRCCCESNSRGFSLIEGLPPRLFAHQTAFDSAASSVIMRYGKAIAHHSNSLLSAQRNLQEIDFQSCRFFCTQKVAPKMHRPRFYALLREFFKLHISHTSYPNNKICVCVDIKCWK